MQVPIDAQETAHAACLESQATLHCLKIVSRSLRQLISSYLDMHQCLALKEELQPTDLSSLLGWLNKHRGVQRLSLASCPNLLSIVPNTLAGRKSDLTSVLLEGQFTSTAVFLLSTCPLLRHCEVAHFNWQEIYPFEDLHLFSLHNLQTVVLRDTQFHLDYGQFPRNLTELSLTRSDVQQVADNRSHHSSN